jgi:uncharacterized protein YndB with AHSA1/START domain
MTNTTSEKDYTTTVSIAREPHEVFDAILNARDWWNDAIDGPTGAVGDEFGFEVEGLHRVRMRVTRLVPGERVEWVVVDNHFSFVTDQTEWVGDRIEFALTPDGDGTSLRFTQHGLVPELECYDVCSNAWGFFVRDSLRELAEHGAGKPETHAGTAAPAERARAAADSLGAGA